MMLCERSDATQSRGMRMTLRKSLTRTIFLTLLIFGIFDAAHGQGDSIYRLPAGTRIKLKLDAELSSKFSSVNDTFIASLAEPVIVRNVVVVPAGTLVGGRVIAARPAASGGKNGSLDLSFESMKFSDDDFRNIDAVLVDKLTAAANNQFGVLSVVGGAGIGALFGSISGSSRGALIGGGIGAAIGTGIALSRKGKEVKIDKNVKFEIKLRREVVVPVLDY